MSKRKCKSEPFLNIVFSKTIIWIDYNPGTSEYYRQKCLEKHKCEVSHPVSDMIVNSTLCSSSMEVHFIQSHVFSFVIYGSKKLIILSAHKEETSLYFRFSAKSTSKQTFLMNMCPFKILLNLKWPSSRHLLVINVLQRGLFCFLDVSSSVLCV